MIIGKDFNHFSWERTSPSGRVPGTLRYVSLAEANRMIYVFGLSEEKSVLWVYDISQECEFVTTLN